MYATRSVATTRRRARSSLSAVRSASIAASAPLERRCAAFAFSAASVVVSGLPSSPSSDLSRAMSDERSADASTRSARVVRASSSSACRCASSASPSPPSASSAGRGAGGASSASRNSSRSESSSSAARRRRTSRWSFISRNASILSESARWRGTSRCACGSFDFCSTGSSSARPSCFISSRRSGISFSSFATASFCDFTACSRKPFTPDEIASSAAALGLGQPAREPQRLERLLRILLRRAGEEDLAGVGRLGGGALATRHFELCALCEGFSAAPRLCASLKRGQTASRRRSSRELAASLTLAGVSVIERLSTQQHHHQRSQRTTEHSASTQ